MDHLYSSKSQYIPVSTEEKSPSQDAFPDHPCECSHTVPPKRRIFGIASSPLRISLFVNAICLIFMTLIGVHWLWGATTLNKELRRCSTYSPVHDQLDLEPLARTLNGTLFPAKDKSIARQMPNPEADKIWDEWELTRVIPLTRQDIIKMGKDPSYTAKLEDDIWGLGDDAYAGTFDVYHQLHCLNSLRQIAYGHYYNRTTYNASPAKASLREFHLNHCVDMLMQALQCSGNVNIMTLDWVETQQYPFPDMSINRQCINFDKLTNWRKANTIDMDKYTRVMEKPEGVNQKKMSDQYYKYHGLENPNHINGANPGEDFNV